jgi:hypothetical protein
MFKLANRTQSMIAKTLGYNYPSQSMFDSVTGEIFTPRMNSFDDVMVFTNTGLEGRNLIVMPRLSELVEWLRVEYTVYVKVYMNRISAATPYDDVLNEEITNELTKLLEIHNANLPTEAETRARLASEEAHAMSMTEEHINALAIEYSANVDLV